MPKIVAFTDIVYSDVHERCALDVFRPVGNENAPLVVLVHGGGWTGGHRFQYQQSCIRLANEGFAAATIGYRLMPDAVWPEIAHDPLRGMALLCERADEFGIDATRAVTWGSSAGGHLALSLQAWTAAWVEQGVVPAAPEIIGTVAQCPAGTIQKSNSVSDKQKELRGGCPPEEVYPGHVPTEQFSSALVVHGDADEVIPLDHSREFVERLSNAGIDARLEVLPGVGHGYGYNLAGDAAQTCMDLAIPYLRERLKAR